MRQILLPQQQIVMTQAMQEALRVLQLGVDDLSDYIEEEIEKNPLLERCKKGKEPLPLPELVEAPSLTNNLLAQAREAFTNLDELKIAEEIISNLDERGYCVDTINVKQFEAVLHTIQTFEPAGIAARNLQECLLLQLKGGSTAYTIIKEHFTDLTRMKTVWKKLKISCPEKQKKS